MKNIGIMIAGAGILSLVGILVIGLFFLSFYNGAVTTENSLKAQYVENQNTYSAFTSTVLEKAGVADGHADKFGEIFLQSMDSRYEGKNPMMNWITEQNPGLETDLYKEVSISIEAGRQDFRRQQKLLTDKKRVYEDTLYQFPGFMLASAFGFPGEVRGVYAPNKDLDGDGRLTPLDYPIVVTGKTRQVFESGEDEILNPFGKEE